MKLSQLERIIILFGDMTFKELEDIAFSSKEMKSVILGKGDIHA